TNDRSPPAWTAESIRKALTSAGVGVSLLGVQPMKLRATAMPMDAPMPAVPPPPMAADAATTIDEIVDVLVALSDTLPPLSITLSWTEALVLVRITFCA